MYNLSSLRLIFFSLFRFYFPKFRIMVKPFNYFSNYYVLQKIYYEKCTCFIVKLNMRLIVIF